MLLGPVAIRLQFLFIVLLTGCEDHPPNSPSPPPPAPCSDPTKCLRVAAEPDMTGACIYPSPNNRKNQWYARDYATYTTKRKITFKYIREKYYVGGTKYGEDPESPLISLATGQAVPLGCQLGKETAAGDVILEYRIKVTCIAFEGTPCVSPALGGNADMDMHPIQPRKLPSVVCPADIPARPEYSSSFAWLASTLRNDKAFPINSKEVEQQFHQPPGNCDRKSITLGAGLIMNQTDVACYFDVNFDLNSKMTKVKISIPADIAAERYVQKDSVDLDFLDDRAPSLFMTVEGVEDTSRSGPIVRTSIDQRRVRIYVKNSHDQLSCVSYRYRN